MADGSLLSALRVLDLAQAEGEGVGRILADLGADVLKIEPSGRAAARTARPTVADVSIPFTLGNANKRCARLDPDRRADRHRLVELAETADIVVDSGNPGGAARYGTSCAELAARFGHLVTLSITDFGAEGPYASWRATDAVFYAMSSALSRTGPTVGTPVHPPNGVASATAAAQATWAALVAYYQRLRSGRGDYIDFSRFEAVVQVLDPPFGTEGQAVVGLKSVTELWRGRPRNQQIYPIIECRDGRVRVCVLSARQWRAMRAWLGEPARFAGAEFDTIAARYTASAELNAAYAELFGPHTRADLVAEGRQRGVPVAALLTPAEVLRAEHFQAAGALREVDLAAGVTVTAPVGPLVVDGSHRGLVCAAADPASAEPVWLRPASAPDIDAAPPTRPFEGVRILDLGVIVAGGELGRLFADLGADVIKVESRTYPDGLRQAPPDTPMSRSWALTHRNQRGLGLDLRHPGGATLFGRLVQDADAVFANFKPGTLGTLGFSFDRLRALNPGIVLAESSAFGDRGPWSAQLGYGPLVRAAAGVTALWTSADADAGTCYDATTVFPDHVVARLTAIATVAVLIRRRQTGDGGHVHVSQAEVAINQLAANYVVESARAQGLPVADDDAVDGVYPCTGEDEWCVICLRTPEDRAAVAEIIGQRELPAARAELHAALAGWTATRDKRDVAHHLQKLGVPAAPMNRAADVAEDPQLVFRGLFTPLHHPLLDTDPPTETAPAAFTHLPRAELRPAPMPGEHTRQICRQLLGLTPEQIDSYIADGALFS